MSNNAKNRTDSFQYAHQFSRFFKKEYLILLGIFLLAIFLRINADPLIPFHYDPGKNIVYARAALQWFPLVPQFNPYFNLGEYYEYQVLFPYLVAFFSQISGASLVEIAKWLAIISGATLSLTVYFFTIEIFNNKTAALVSAFLIAVSKIQLLGYMNYYPQILAMTLMPLSLLFLIRYVKHQQFLDLILVAILSSLIVLGSYIVGLVYFIILLLSLAVWSLFDKKSLKTLILAPLMTTLLLAFFWLPIVWRHGFTQIIGVAVTRIFATTGTFTNQPWTLSTFFTLSYGAIIAIGAIVCAIIIVKKIKWDFQKTLLSVWLVTTFLLMESYLVMPILWVDRYFPLFEIAVLICGGIVISIIINYINSIKIGPKYKGYFLLVILIIPLLGGVNLGWVFGKWGYPSDFAMVDYMQQNLPSDSLVVAPPGIQGFWVSALSGVRILDGESAQMLGQTYLGDRDSEKIINSADVEQKMQIIRKFGVEYIYIPYHKDVVTIWNPDLSPAGVRAFNNETYFENIKIYNDDYGFTALVKVREELQPQYIEEKIDWTVTAIGYIISITSLCGFIYIQRYRKDWTARVLQ